MIRAVMSHPLGVMLLGGSLLLAGTLRFLPWAGGLSSMAPWVLIIGVVGYTAMVVALLWPGPEDSLPVSQQLDPDLSDSKIKKRLRSEALRRPATLLSLALVVISACYLALLESALGGGLVVMAVGAVALAAGAGIYLWQYVMHYSEHYAAMVHRLTIVSTEARDRAEQAELDRLSKRLEEGFPAVGSDLGLKALKGLNVEFLKLGTALENQGKATSISLAAVPRLAGETYRRGISVLGDALDLMRAIEGTNLDQIEADIADIEGEIKSLANDGSQRTRTLIREETLASHRLRLSMQEQLRLRSSQLLHLASRCEATLHVTRIQIAGIKTGGLESGVYPVVEALQETVRRAKEVQEELQQLGY